MLNLKYVGITLIFPLLGLLGCKREGPLQAGKYAVADAEYSQDFYDLRRDFKPDGSFTEAHSLSNCLMMELQGHWTQKGDVLTLSYSASHQRSSCREPMPNFKADSAQLTIPIRHVEEASFESFLTSSGGKPEKWLRWNRQT